MPRKKSETAPRIYTRRKVPTNPPLPKTQPILKYTFLRNASNPGGGIPNALSHGIRPYVFRANRNYAADPVLYPGGYAVGVDEATNKPLAQTLGEYAAKAGSVVNALGGVAVAAGALTGQPQVALAGGAAKSLGYGLYYAGAGLSALGNYQAQSQATGGSSEKVYTSKVDAKGNKVLADYADIYKQSYNVSPAPKPVENNFLNRLKYEVGLGKEPQTSFTYEEQRAIYARDIFGKDVDIFNLNLTNDQLRDVSAYKHRNEDFFKQYQSVWENIFGKTPEHQKLDQILYAPPPLIDPYKVNVQKEVDPLYNYRGTRNDPNASRYNQQTVFNQQNMNAEELKGLIVDSARQELGVTKEDEPDDDLILELKKMFDEDKSKTKRERFEENLKLVFGDLDNPYNTGYTDKEIEDLANRRRFQTDDEFANYKRTVDAAKAEREEKDQLLQYIFEKDYWPGLLDANYTLPELRAAAERKKKRDGKMNQPSAPLGIKTELEQEKEDLRRANIEFLSNDKSPEYLKYLYENTDETDEELQLFADKKRELSDEDFDKFLGDYRREKNGQDVKFLFGENADPAQYIMKYGLDNINLMKQQKQMLSPKEYDQWVRANFPTEKEDLIRFINENFNDNENYTTEELMQLADAKRNLGSKQFMDYVNEFNDRRKQPTAQEKRRENIKFLFGEDEPFDSVKDSDEDLQLFADKKRELSPSDFQEWLSHFLVEKYTGYIRYLYGDVDIDQYIRQYGLEDIDLLVDKKRELGEHEFQKWLAQYRNNVIDK